MKRILSSVFVGACLIAFFAFHTSEHQTNFSTAKVVKIDGFYIFTDSKPVMAHDSLGVVDLGFVSGTQYESIRTNLIKQARKKFPISEGLIFELNKKGIDKCTVIKFK